jgi:hypothetical protein
MFGARYHPFLYFQLAETKAKRERGFSQMGRIFAGKTKKICGNPPDQRHPRSLFLNVR